MARLAVVRVAHCVDIHFICVTAEKLMFCRLRSCHVSKLWMLEELDRKRVKAVSVIRGQAYCSRLGLLKMASVPAEMKT